MEQSILVELVKQYGQVKDMILPSGIEVVIREQNGEDESLLSNVALSKSSDSLNSFIRAMIVYLPTAVNPNSPTLDEIMVRPLNDKYFILIASRIFSLGSTLEFNYSWGKDTEPVAYKEDLEQYIWDYSKPLPKLGEPDYFEQRIPKYESIDSHHMLTLSSGKVVRYKPLDSYGEKYLLKLPDTEKHINQKVLARGLEIKVNGEFTPVESFANFKSREMAEIRDHIDKHDPEFAGLTELENPYNAGEIEVISIIQIQDFFFPRGM
jgi:hypothetical protein